MSAMVSCFPDAALFVHAELLSPFFGHNPSAAQLHLDHNPSAAQIDLDHNPYAARLEHFQLQQQVLNCPA